MHDPTLPTAAALGLPGAGQTVWRDKLSQLLESTGEGIFGIDMLGWLPVEVLGSYVAILSYFQTETKPSVPQANQKNSTHQGKIAI